MACAALSCLGNDITIKIRLLRGKNMTWKEAIKYCEEHECKYCIHYINDIDDCRTEYEKQVLHMPCCVNLVDEDLRYK